MAAQIERFMLTSKNKTLNSPGEELYPKHRTANSFLVQSRYFIVSIFVHLRIKLLLIFQ